MAKVLMVDVDGVLIRHPDPRGWSVRLEEDLGVPVRLLQDAFFRVHWTAISHGHAGLRERLEPVLAEIAPFVPVDRFIRYWFEQDAHVDQELLADLAAIRAEGLQVHLATVQEHLRAAYIWDELGFKASFDAMHYAADLGCAKPDKAFYSAIEARTGFAPADIVFIDDREDNVAAALARGWTAHLWGPGSKLAQLVPSPS